MRLKTPRLRNPLTRTVAATPKKRAQITRDAAKEMYEDLLDRVTAPVDEEAVERSRRARRKPEEPPLVKVTVYMTPDDVLAIDHIVSEEFRATGRKPRRSAVVSRAIQLYASQYEPPEKPARS